MKTLQKLIAAAGLSLAMGTATAGITWNLDGSSTLFQDDDLDFALTVDTDAQGYDPDDASTWTLIPDTDDTINVGDVLIAIVEFNTAAGVDIGPGQELTGVSVIQVASLGQAGLFSQFVPYAGGLNAATGVNVPGGGAGEGAMLALWLDNSPDLAVDAGLVPSNLSCSTLAECITQATDGDLWQVDGFDDDTSNNYWSSIAITANYSTILESPASQIKGFYNAGLDILYNGTGKELLLASLPGDLGPVDALLNGTINGGGAVTAADKAALASLIADGYTATTDTDLEKIAVPEPATLALLGVGLLGLGFSRRRLA